jgi:predicted lipid-binding transport protein (Tim44 family)
MRRPVSSLLAAVAAAALALAPVLADARPGGGSSSGSRGSRTYSAPPPTNTAPGQTRSFDRTATEPGRPGVGQPGAVQPRPPIGQPNPAGGFFSRNPMMAGLMGGLLGAGLFGLLAGQGLFGGMGGLMSILGLLLQIALIGGLVWLVVRLLRGNRAQPRPAMAGGGLPPEVVARDMHGSGGGPLAGGGGLARGAARPSAEFPIEQADYQAFDRLLREVNEAWSRQDLGTLRRIATPEMVQYFAQDLSDLEARGWRNETREVRLEQGDLAEAWREGARDWATVAMRFSMIDFTRRVADGAVVEGDAQRRTEATELWTFVRPAGGQWVLSAIQQAG